MAWIQIFPERNYPSAKQTSGVYDVALGVTQVTLRASRLSWPNTGQEVIQASFDLSFDGGATWISPYCGFGARGGDYYFRTGILAEYSMVTIALPQPDNPNRKIRGTMNTTTNLRTKIEAEII